MSILDPPQWRVHTVLPEESSLTRKTSDLVESVTGVTLVVVAPGSMSIVPSKVPVK